MSGDDLKDKLNIMNDEHVSLLIEKIVKVTHISKHLIDGRLSFSSILPSLSLTMYGTCQREMSHRL